jgi:lipid-A-disaccharide synthase-like uncharacterized protein
MGLRCTTHGGGIQPLSPASPAHTFPPQPMSLESLEEDMEAGFLAVKQVREIWMRRAWGSTLDHISASMNLFICALDGDDGAGVTDMHFLVRWFAEHSALVGAMPRMFRAPSVFSSRDPQPLEDFLRNHRQDLVRHMVRVLEALRPTAALQPGVAAQQLEEGLRALRQCSLEDPVPMGELPESERVVGAH